MFGHRVEYLERQWTGCLNRITPFEGCVERSGLGAVDGGGGGRETDGGDGAKAAGGGAESMSMGADGGESRSEGMDVLSSSPKSRRRK